MRGSEFSHTFQEYFANPRQHLCQFSQLFHVEQFSRASLFQQARKPQRRLPKLFHVEQSELCHAKLLLGRPVPKLLPERL
jgi:hypothetical protein